MRGAVVDAAFREHAALMDAYNGEIPMEGGYWRMTRYRLERAVDELPERNRYAMWVLSRSFPLDARARAGTA